MPDHEKAPAFVDAARGEAQRTELFLQSVLDSLKDRVNIVDENYNIIYANAALAQSCGKSRDKLIGETCYELYWGNERPCEVCVTPETFRTGMPQHTAHWETADDGSELYIEHYTFPIVEKGKVKYVIECLRDATHRKNQEHKAREQALELGKRLNQLRHAYKERQLIREQLLHAERMASIGQMASSMAHELDTPLSTMSGYCEMLIESIADDADRAKVQSIAEQAERCQKIIRNALDYARGPTATPEPADVNKIITDTIALMDYTTRVARVKVVTEFADGLPTPAMDSEKMQQVFLNLIRNACDAMPDGGEIHITTRRDGDSIRIVVRDTGEGIPEADRDRIFEPFYTTKGPGKGTGLGLSICQSIVRECGGEIAARNAEGPGAEFVITIPLPD
ncbi:MAG: PAS domain-containing sensor histidine kinase [Planctomycetes bacterium]|nr:PAS domain-containing sensor histidine kinase [Planctomycetota bacterium]